MSEKRNVDTHKGSCEYHKNQHNKDVNHLDPQQKRDPFTHEDATNEEENDEETVDYSMPFKVTQQPRMLAQLTPSTQPILSKINTDKGFISKIPSQF